MADEDQTTNDVTQDDTAVETDVVSASTAVADPPVDDVVDNGDAGVDQPAGDQASVENAWQQPYRELGFENLESPEQAQQHALEALRRERAQREEAQRQAQWYQAVYANQVGQSPVGQASSEPVAPAPSSIFAQMANDWPEIAQDEIDPFVERDEKGRATGWKQGTPPSVIERSNAYIRARQKWDEIVQDPRKMSEAIEQHFQSMLDSHLDGRLQQREQMTVEQRAEQEFMTANQDWMFEKDPYTGKPSKQPTAAGRQFYSIFESTESQYGVTNLAKRIQLAEQLFRAQQHAAGITQNQSPGNRPTMNGAPPTVPVGQQQPAARPTAADARRQMLGQRNGNPARPTSVAGVNDGAGGDPAGASRMSFGQSVLNGLKNEGLA